MVEEKSEIPFDPGLKFLWVCAMGFLSYINYCLFHLWGFFTWNFHPACLQPELHWLPSPVLCTREEVLPLSFPRPSLLLHQRCPIVYILFSVFSHFLFFLGSFKYQWASPGLKKTFKQTNKQTNPSYSYDFLFISSFSLPIFKKVYTSFFSLSATCLHSSVTLHLLPLLSVIIPPWSIYLVSPTRP